MDKKKIVIISSICCLVVVILIGLITIATINFGNHSYSGDVLGVQDIISGDYSGDLSGDNLSGDNSGEQIVQNVYTGPQIFSGDARPIAVMIDNEIGARPQAGLNDAYMIYEITVEGGETRYMAFFKGTTPDKIGPVRSSRHYFLDYALEHDAIYVHFRWSPLAQSDIKTYGINNINGIYDNFYWREPIKGWHNAFTSMSNIMNYANRKKYRTTSDAECVLKYNEQDKSIESEMTANKIYLKYSYVQNSQYLYDKDRKVYLRSVNGTEHRDRWTNEQFYAKNIVILKVKNNLLDDPENKGRQQLYNVGTGDGFYITNGEYEPITWKKEDRKSRTIYYDQQGNEIKFNDGITWVNIVPLNATITIE